MSHYELILLDLDDTLLDFPRAQTRAFGKSLATVGVELTDDLLSKFIALNHELWGQYEKETVTKEHVFRMRWELLLNPLGFSGDSLAVNDCFLAELAEEPIWIEGAEKFCQKLAGRFTICLLSNGDSPTQHKRIKTVGLEKYIKHIVISDEVGVGKPHPRIFDYALDKAGFRDKQKVLMIGDNFHADIVGAVNFGIDACWYNPNKTSPKADVKLTRVVSHYDEITSWLVPS